MQIYSYQKNDTNMIQTNIRIGKYSNIFEYLNIRHTLEHILPLQQTTTLARDPSWTDLRPRTFVWSTFAEDVDWNVFLEFSHVFLPPWVCFAIWHDPSHQLFLGQLSHSVQDGLNTGRLWRTKASIRCKHIRIPSISHCQVEEVRNLE